jgi:biotin synthase
MFVGGKLLTTALPGQDEDTRLLADLGMRPMGAAREVSLAN